MSGDLTFNKYAAAILATALGFMLIKEVSHKSMHVSIPDIPAYGADLVVDTGTTAEVPLDLPFPQPEFIAAMDAEKGAKVFKKCTSCHNVEEGGSNGTGPNIWDIVGKTAGQKAGFSGYSGAMTTSGITWNYEELNDFLKKPKDYLSGTKMNFVGLKKEADRAAVIEYLRVASASPMALPVAAATPQESEEQTEDLNEVIAEDDAGGELIENITVGVDKTAENVGEATQNVTQGVKDVAGDVADAAGDAVDATVDAAGDAADKAGDLLDKATDAVNDAVDGSAEDVVDDKE